ALKIGVRYFDTAPLYGVGESEMRFGKALSGVDRDSFVISTKVGRVLHPVEPGSAQMTWSFDFSRRGAQRSFKESLERLGMERIDILLIHDPDNHYPQALTQAFPVLMELRAQGLVKAIGAGMNQWEMELKFAKEGDFDCFLLAGRYTLLEQTSLSEFLPYCVEKKISIVAGGPYNSGILAADNLSPSATYNYQSSPPAVVEKARKIRAVCDRHNVPMKAAALQFILAHPALASVIPGARSAKELEENFEMVKRPIPAAFWAELKAERLIVGNAPTPS
ncbi:MAG: aldo/keto reductase, partial [Chloroflexi bacterium]|nr:aldo/keto reductase [Chloroflexota bacterium]